MEASDLEMLVDTTSHVAVNMDAEEENQQHQPGAMATTTTTTTDDFLLGTTETFTETLAAPAPPPPPGKKTGTKKSKSAAEEDPNKPKQIRKTRLQKPKKGSGGEDSAAAPAANFFASQQSLGLTVNLKDTVSRSLTAMMQDNTLRSAEGSQNIMAPGGGIPTGLMPTGLPSGVDSSPFSVMMGGAGVSGGGGGSQMVRQMSAPQLGMMGGRSLTMNNEGSNSMLQVPQVSPNTNSVTAPTSGLQNCTQMVKNLVQQRKDSAIGLVMHRQASTNSNNFGALLSSGTQGGGGNSRGPQFPATAGGGETGNEENSCPQEADQDVEIELCVEEATAPPPSAIRSKRGKRNRILEETTSQPDSAGNTNEDGSSSRQPEGSSTTPGSQGDESDGESEEDEDEEEDDELSDLTKEERRAIKRYETGTPLPEDNDEDEADGVPSRRKKQVVLKKKYGNGTTIISSSTTVANHPADAVELVDDSDEDADGAMAEAARVAEEALQEHDAGIQRRHEIERLQSAFLKNQHLPEKTTNSSMVSPTSTTTATTTPTFVNKSASSNVNNSQSSSLVALLANNSSKENAQTSPMLGSMKSQPNNKIKSQPVHSQQQHGALDAASRRKALMNKKTSSVFSKVNAEHVETLRRTNSFDKATSGPVVFGGAK